MTTPTYEQYLAYAERIGVTPYSPAEWTRMGAQQKMLIGIAIGGTS